MHAVRNLTVAALVTAAALPITASPASSQEGSGGGPADGGVTPTDDGYLGRVRDQVETLNEYEVPNPPPCHYFDVSPTGADHSLGYDGHLNPLPEGAHNGYWRWRLLREVPVEDDSGWADGLQYVLECYAEGQPVDVVEEDGWANGWNAVGIFDAVNPENLARLAMEEFFLGLPAPVPSFSPASPTLVDFDTWMWVEDPEGAIPDPGEEVASEVISVPGIAVQAFASVGEVLWEMGDGQTKSCPVTTSAESAQAADCIYSYDVSSAGQPDNAYQGSATLVWQGRYTINREPAPEELPDIPRETPFTLAVEEAQALNTDD